MNVGEKRINQLPKGSVEVPGKGSTPLAQSRLIEDPLALSMFRLGLPGVLGARATTHALLNWLMPMPGWYFPRCLYFGYQTC